MKYINIYDTHTHSINSFDGNHTCYELCNSAIKKGIKGIAITDHMDIDGTDFNAEKQYNDAQITKDVYFGHVDVLIGVELGQGIYRKDMSIATLNKYDYDFVIGSIHNLEDMEDFYFLDYSKYDIDDLLTQYFMAEYELAKWNQCDTLAHLTYPLRYIVAREHINVDISKFYDIIDATFLELIKNNKALELNTSGLFMPMNDTLPNINLVKRYKELGGKYVTVGSDSHYFNKIGQGVDVGYDMLQSIGYEDVTIFKEREPVLVSIK